MYRVYVNDLLIQDQMSPDLDVHMIDPKLLLSDNAAGSFDFTLPPNNPGYNEIQRMVSTIIVQKEGKTIWTGRAIKSTEDFWKRRTFNCEGALAYLNDTLQPSVAYDNTNNQQFFIELIKQHNAKARPDRRFNIGRITVHDLGDPFTYETDYQNTWGIIQEVFINRLGGHIYITYDDSKFNISNSEVPTPIINYIAEYNTSRQEINFGDNLLDFVKNWDLSDLVTVIYPRGKQLDTKNTSTTSGEASYNNDNTSDDTVVVPSW